MTTLLTRKSVASSKADIFEAKINSAIDETNTSDSEETFVYDSNPPDNNDRAHRRFHSRTPSATSMVSQADRQNLRSIYGIMEGAGPAHGPKRSMKFVNTFNNGSDALTTGDEDGKVRMWDLDKRQSGYLFEGHRSGIECVDASPDGRWLVAGAEDGSLRMWELAWEWAFPGSGEWTAEADPHVNAFVLRNGLGSPAEFKEELQCRWLLDLQCVGFGWIRRECAVEVVRQFLTRHAPKEH